MADDADEGSHAGARATLHVRLVDRPAGGQRVLAVRHERGERRLVGDERPHVVGMLRDEGEGVDRAAAAGEAVHRPADGLDDPMDVIGVDARALIGLAGSASTLRSDPRGS